MPDDIIVDLIDRSGDLSVADLKQAIQVHKVFERDNFGRYSDVLKNYGVGRPMPLSCLPGLRK